MSKQIGLIYQKLIEYMLLNRHFVVSETIGDYSPYDLICDFNGKISRIQVRSSGRLAGGRNKGYKLATTFGNHQNILSKNECDFLVAVISENHNVYIIPIEKVNSKTMLFHPKQGNYKSVVKENSSYYRWEKYLEAWHLLK